MGNITQDHTLLTPAGERNLRPIGDFLRTCLPERGRVLELASGTGGHIAHFARAWPRLSFQPSDVDPAAVAALADWHGRHAPDNLRPPVRLDAETASTWPEGVFDALLCINMVHISPWRATEGLMRLAQKALLPSGGMMFLYGPYLEDGVATAPSNLAFDRGLRERNPSWGLRSLEAITALARTHGLVLTRRDSLPANNLGLLFRRV